MIHIIDIAQRHARVLSWAAVYAVFVTLSMRHLDGTEALIVSVLTVVPMILTSEVLRRYLIPRYLQRHIWLFFFLLLLLLWAIVAGAAWCDRHTLEWLGIPLPGARDGNHGNPNIYFYAKHTYLTLITAVQTSVSRLIDERKRLVSRVRVSQMQLELKYLRSQINPHFLFNALNTIYALTLMKDDHAPASVMRLSEMLRYVIDDCQSETVPLRKEIHYIENFIAFYRLRIEHDADITLAVCGLGPESDHTSSHGPAGPAASAAAVPPAVHSAPMVPPMIFQPMVENCFKHSRIADRPDAFVHIALTFADGLLTFTTENSLPPSRPDRTESAAETAQPPRATADPERIGIGMANVRQRLDLLYGAAYTLHTEQDNGTYRLRLTLRP